MKSEEVEALEKRAKAARQQIERIKALETMLEEVQKSEKVRIQFAIGADFQEAVSISVFRRRPGRDYRWWFDLGAAGISESRIRSAIAEVLLQEADSARKQLEEI
jgi:hypothetical protein